MIKGGYIVSALCVYALLSVATSCTPASAAEAAPRQEVMVSVPLSRLTELQSLIDKQEQRLEQLEMLLEGQRSTLSGQQSSISQLRQELATAKSSLANSKLIIDEQNSSLMSLSESIKRERRRTRRIERQRLLWQVVAGGAVAYTVLKE